MGSKKEVSDGYLMTLWRRAVLANYNNRCALCGNENINELECHHIIKRRHKILRWDWRNGIPGCKYTCHKWYHTKLGEKFISGEHWDYDLISSMENMTYKQYLVDNGMTDNEFRTQKKEELKKMFSEKNNYAPIN